jgi:hypothetical protein
MINSNLILLDPLQQFLLTLLIGQKGSMFITTSGTLVAISLT